MDRYAAPVRHQAAFSPILVALGTHAGGWLALIMGLGFLIGTATALVRMVEAPSSAILAGAAVTFFLALLSFGAGFAKLAQAERRS